MDWMDSDGRTLPTECSRILRAGQLAKIIRWTLAKRIHLTAMMTNVPDNRLPGGITTAYVVRLTSLRQSCRFNPQ